MVVLAREIRGMTQQYLASRIAMSLYALSRIERGLQAEVSDQQATTIADALDFPVEFLRQHHEPVGSASSPCCSAGNAALDELDQKRVRGILSALRINIRQLLGAVEVVPDRALPNLAGEQIAGSATRAARMLRSLWKVPRGPVANLTALIEGAGVIVIRCDFGMSAAGATSVRHGDKPPLILIDRNIGGDQYRVMLAHQLAHLVMHQAPFPKMEREAEEFAHEFLLPESGMQAAFSRPGDLALADLASLKSNWKVPIAALLERAHAMNLIDATARNRLWTNARIRGYLIEPHSPPHEETRTLRGMLDCFVGTRGTGVEELARAFKIGMRDVGAWYGSSMPVPRRQDQHHGPVKTPGDVPGDTVVRPAGQHHGVAADRV